MKAFTHLVKFLNVRKRFKHLRDRMEMGRRYLKTHYQNHCSDESDITSHNPLFALSYQAEEPCAQISNKVCKNCYGLISALSETQKIAENEGAEDTIHDVNSSVKAIITYMKHQKRDYQQRQAKAYCFNNLDNETGFWLKDFAQKILPMRFREGQREYFGKRHVYACCLMY